MHGPPTYLYDPDLERVAHYNGTIGDPDSATVEKQLWNDRIN
jgi:hypothetical protein